jgi:hypothetical protein
MLLKWKQAPENSTRFVLTQSLSVTQISTALQGTRVSASPHSNLVTREAFPFRDSRSVTDNSVGEPSAITELQSAIDARVGGNVNENNRLLKRAKERVQAAVIVFTTRAGKASVSLEWQNDEDGGRG